MTSKTATDRGAATKPRSPAKAAKAPKTVGKEDPAFYEALGRAIKVARVQLGVERKVLAELANVSYAYLSDIETGRGRPGSRSLLAIAEALGRSVGDLMHEADLYRQQMTGEPGPEAIGSPAAMPGSLPRRWFHDASMPAPPVRAEAAREPSLSELRAAWRERLDATESEHRAELHQLIDRLPHEDVVAVLGIVTRLTDDAG